jgi:phosphatidate cytidylyltransferase
MLPRRLATALIFIPPFLLGLLTDSPGHLVLAFIGAGCGIWGLSEFFNLGARRGAHPPRRWLYFIALITPFVVYARYWRHEDSRWLVGSLIAIGIVTLIGILVSVVFSGRCERAWETFLVSFTAPLYILIPIVGVQVIRQMDQGGWVIVFAFITTWLSDTGAFFGGRLIGKHKLAPSISPGKTIEGSICGTLLSVIGVLSIGAIHENLSPGKFYWTNGEVEDWIRLTLLTILLVGTGTLGDLAESMLKRDLGVKDSGSSLTGHGGFLDIMDSLLVNLPILFVWVVLIEDLLWF